MDALQSLVDKVEKRLPPWKGHMLLCYSYMHIHGSKDCIMGYQSHWNFNEGFPLVREQGSFGKKVEVAWVNTCVPKDIGGLGIPRLWDNGDGSDYAMVVSCADGDE